MPRERSNPHAAPDPFDHTVEAVIGQLLSLEKVAREQAAQLREAGASFDGSDPRITLCQAETAANCWHRCVTLLGDVLRQSRQGGRR